MTVSYAQSQRDVKDTIKCYGITELRVIAASMIELEACDTLLSNSRSMLANRDSLILEKDYELSVLSGELALKDKLIRVKEDDIKSLNLNLDKANKHKKLLTLGWGSTSFLLTGFLIYFAIK